MPVERISAGLLRIMIAMVWPSLMPAAARAPAALVDRAPICADENSEFANDSVGNMRVGISWHCLLPTEGRAATLAVLLCAEHQPYRHKSLETLALGDSSSMIEDAIFNRQVLITSPRFPRKRNEERPRVKASLAASTLVANQVWFGPRCDLSRRRE